MKLKHYLASLLLLIHIYAISQNVDNIPTSQPSFQVDYAMPTADKPQSKLWHMHECWWAILPRSSGPSLWQRTKEGWKEHVEVTKALQGIPGRVDVWANDSEVFAVGIADIAKTNLSMTVFRLVQKINSSEIRWEVEILSELLPPSDKDTIETATIARDGKGKWWVAAVTGTKVCVWHSTSKGVKWSSPMVLAEEIADDDICVITPLPRGIGVIWTDQVREAVMMRMHKDGQPPKKWQTEEIIEMGNKTADDHLNTSLSPNGTLWVASKNSVDKVGQPQFVLRKRSMDGKWENRPYVILGKLKSPSRPIVVATEDDSIVFTGYGDNDRSMPFPHESKIFFALVDQSLVTVIHNPQVVISPDNALQSIIQNVTGPRHPFPKDAPWIILASDREGRVYEADLRKLITAP